MWSTRLWLVSCALAHISCEDQRPTSVLVNLHVAPILGLPCDLANFAWVCPHLGAADYGGEVQVGYQLHVANDVSFHTLVIDTGYVVRNASNADLSLASLSPATRYYVRLRVWMAPHTNRTTALMSAWSIAFEIGTALCDGFTKSSPIWAPTSNSTVPGFVLARRAVCFPPHFSATATAFITAAQSGDDQRLLGSYRLVIGGKAVGIGPGRGENNFKAQIASQPYDAIDITHTLHEALGKGSDGDGCRGSLVVFGVQAYHDRQTSSRSQGQIQAEFHFEQEGAGRIVVGTDSSWMVFDADSAFNASGSTGGAYQSPVENTDARRYPTNWTLPSFEVSDLWVPADVLPTTSHAHLVPKSTLPISLETGIIPESVALLSPGLWAFDMGEDVMGGVTLTLPAHPTLDGARFQITLGEELTHGRVLNPMRTGNHYRNVWVASSHGCVLEHHEYMVFRYGEVEVISNDSEEIGTALQQSLDLKVWRVRYPWYESDSSFQSSDERLNAVWKLSRDTLRITSLDTCTDSNTRERKPYEADCYITSSSRSLLQREYAWIRHSLLTNMNNPTWPTEWRQFLALFALQDYMLTESSEIGNRFSKHLWTEAQLACVDPLSHLVNFTSCARSCSAMQGCRDLTDWPEVSRDGFQFTNVSTIINAFAVGGLRALSHLASATGNHSQADVLARQANDTRDAMLTRLWDGKVFRDGVGTNHTSWHAQVFPLWLGIAPANAQAGLLATVMARGMVGSVYAAFAYLLGTFTVKSDHGRAGHSVMVQNTTNSWLHMLSQNATATMEAWDPSEKPNLSWSHPWATAPVTGIVQGLMGVRAVRPGYGEVEIRPQPGNVTFAALHLPTLRGWVDLWVRQRETGRGLEVDFSLPPNTLATLCLPLCESAPAFSEVRAECSAIESWPYGKVWKEDGEYVCATGIGSLSNARMRCFVSCS